MEKITSFRVLAGEVVEVQPVPMDNACTMELVVVEGGPAFFFRGRKTAAEAAALVEEGRFDLAASGTSKGSLGADQRYGNGTVFAAVETVGYVRVTSHEPK